MFDIFISYRRGDAGGWARALYDALTARLGADEVFMDVTAIEGGADFHDVIDAKLNTAQIQLVLIGPQWLTIADARGRARICDADDLVRREIARALERGIKVIPVLLQGAGMPTAAALPTDIQRLARRNAVTLTEANWRTDVNALGDLLSSILNPEPLLKSETPPTLPAPARVSKRKQALRWTMRGIRVAFKAVGVWIYLGVAGLWMFSLSFAEGIDAHRWWILFVFGAGWGSLCWVPLSRWIGGNGREGRIRFVLVVISWTVAWGAVYQALWIRQQFVANRVVPMLLTGAVGSMGTVVALYRQNVDRSVKREFGAIALVWTITMSAFYLIYALSNEGVDLPREAMQNVFRASSSAFTVTTIVVISLIYLWKSGRSVIGELKKWRATIRSWES